MLMLAIEANALSGPAAAGVLVVTLALVIERALALFFECPLLRPVFRERGAREAAAILVSVVAVWRLGFDGVSAALGAWEARGQAGMFITALVIAGGSRSASLLVVNVLGIGRGPGMGLLPREVTATVAPEHRAGQSRWRIHLETPE